MHQTSHGNNFSDNKSKMEPSGKNDLNLKRLIDDRCISKET